MWEPRVVHPLTVAGMTTLMRASGTVKSASTPDGTALFLDLLEKNAEIARPGGIRAKRKEFLSEYQGSLYRTTSTYRVHSARHRARTGPPKPSHQSFMCRKARDTASTIGFHRDHLHPTSRPTRKATRAPNAY